MQTRLVSEALTFACLLLGGGLVVAHHSIAGQFDSATTLRLNGSVTRVDWFNPHVFVYLDVKDPAGKVTTWKLESLPVAMMRKAGITKSGLIGGGEAVKIDLLPARDGTEHFGFLLKVTFADGRQFQFSRDPNAPAQAAGA